MSTVEFDGTPKDPVPPDLVLELGQKQDTAIKDWQAAYRGLRPQTACVSWAR